MCLSQPPQQQKRYFHKNFYITRFISLKSSYSVVNPDFIIDDVHQSWPSSVSLASFLLSPFLPQLLQSRILSASEGLKRAQRTIWSEPMWLSEDSVFFVTSNLKSVYFWSVLGSVLCLRHLICCTELYKHLVATSLSHLSQPYQPHHNAYGMATEEREWLECPEQRKTT